MERVHGVYIIEEKYSCQLAFSFLSTNALTVQDS